MTVVGEICCCTPNVQRSEYGFFISGLKKSTFCPRKVWSPPAEPTGCRMPFGNGLLSVASGVSSVPGIGNCVVWLKPSCVRIGVDEYVPTGFRFDIAIDCTKTPKPPRMTVLLWNISGDHAKPM